MSRLPFSSGRFDVVLVTMALRHWNHLEAGIEQVQRVLTDGGVLLVADVLSAGPRRGRLRRWTGDRVGLPAELAAAMGAHGLMVVARDRVPWSLLPDIQVIAVLELADEVHDEHDLGAPPASGSFLTDGMIIAPCSMKSLAAIANGISENLIHRAADVALKEGRKLLLLARETPLSVIHLENMLRVARAGALVVPPVPAFYARPRTIDELVDHTVGRVLDHFGVEADLVRRWGERRPTRASGLRATP